MTTNAVDAVFREIEVAKLRPRKVNPNQMPPKAFAGYKKEVKRLGRPPKPIIVRALGNGDFEIVDGEHGWRCACELGLNKVLCEVRELDDFDASRECYLRNRGGKDNPVVLGRMFADMMEVSKLTGRALAKKLGITEGKIRCNLDFLEAFELRSQYAPETAEHDIARLKHDQVRIYAAMEKDLRDRWLDAGADSTAFEGFQGWTSYRVTHAISRSKLSNYLPKERREFQSAVGRIALLAVWLDENKHIQDAQAYAAAAAQAGVTPDAMALLPLGANGEQAAALISTSAWLELLRKAQQTARRQSGQLAEIAAGVRLALQDAGIDPTAVCSPAEAESLRIIEDAADFIKTAKYLSVKEKCWLAEIACEEDNELIRNAQQMTCDILQQSRTAERNGQTRVQSDSVEVVFEHCLRELVHQQKLAADQELFDAPYELVQGVLTKLSDTQAIRDGCVGEQPAVEVLYQRLNGLDWPEFYLLATLIIGDGSAEDAARRWLTAMQGSLAAEVDA